MRLSNTILASLPAEIHRPTYDRTSLTPGIVHIGVGNFHRAHKAWYLHRLMQAGLAKDWAIVGAGVRPNDATMRERLREQDYLTTLIELAPTSRTAEVTGPMIDFLPVEPENGPLIAAMADPAIRIVAMTVTEGGYYIDPSTKGFDADHPDIAHDAASPSTPKTVFGAIVEALRSRREQGIQPFTAMSCDNIIGNGEVLRKTVVGLAQLSDPELAAWIDQNCSFPNSMVDCIVPATGEKELALARDIGIVDAAPVTHENFRQWVIEDDFCAGRPDWDKVGATFTDNVHPYEAMKIRVLNAGHQILANPGELLSVETIADCMAHPLISRYYNKVQTEETAPLIDPIENMTPKDYIALIESRFSNPAIEDTTRRVAFDGSSRHTGFVLPNIRDALAAGTPVSGLILAEALWARMCAGTREDGTEIAPNDPFWNKLLTAAEAAKTRPRAWVEQSQFYGELIGDPRFVEPFEAWLNLIWSEGTEAALQAYLSTETKEAALPGA
ncbi:MAG: mannitol dehydrogenase family protein [Pseudomonadota bacterium]